MIWRLSHRADQAARELADRHYSRQKVGAVQFAPAGSCRVLFARAAGGSAYWVTSWPFAEFVKHEWAVAWLCSAFRNEGAGLSSTLITEAVAATRALYGEPPSLGMVTFIDVDKVRHKRDPGRCFLKAGFVHVGWTKGGLRALRLLPECMPPPEMPLGATADIFGGAAA